MKKNIFVAICCLVVLSNYAQQAFVNYEYKLITTIESVVPGGLGRSRLLETDDNKQVQEKDLENFFSLVGINFKNIANNDRVIADKLSQMNKDGWEFFNLTTGVYGTESSTGIFITRYFFRRVKK